MMRLVEKYATDIKGFAAWPLEKYFDFVCRIPYRPDPKEQETISRPAHLLKSDFPYRDCDDKAILIGSWLYIHGVPFRYVSTSTRPDGRLHHVFVELKSGEFLDATYAKNVNFYKKLAFADKITNFVPLTDFF